MGLIPFLSPISIVSQTVTNNIMDEDHNQDTGFVTDEVNQVITDSIELVIGGAQYESKKIDGWMNSVIEQCIENLTRLDKPYKYWRLPSSCKKRAPACRVLRRAIGTNRPTDLARCAGRIRPCTVLCQFLAWPFRNNQNLLKLKTHHFSIF